MDFMEYSSKERTNGVDTSVYDPANDSRIYAGFSAEDMSNKAVNKAELQKELGLEVRADVPVIGMISRLVSNKGFDLVKEGFEAMMSKDIQIIILGSGEWIYESYFEELTSKYPGRFAFSTGYNPELEHKIYAGSDILLMPSRTEPCGLSQMHALRYGTIPVVRETGGLRDTITDYSKGDEANGFSFAGYNTNEMVAAVNRAVELYSDKKAWNNLVDKAINCDNSWKRSAGEYIKLYKELCEGK